VLTKERLDALSLTALGGVKQKHVPAPGAPTVWEPRELSVALGFLLKAACIQPDEYGEVHVTERGKNVLARIQT